MYVVMASCKRGCRHPDDAMRPAAQGGCDLYARGNECPKMWMWIRITLIGDGACGGCIGLYPGDVRGVDLHRKTVVTFPEWISAVIEEDMVEVAESCYFSIFLIKSINSRTPEAGLSFILLSCTLFCEPL